MEKIETIEWKDWLNEFYNYHSKELASAKINIEVYRDIAEKQGEKAVVGHKKVFSHVGPDGKPQYGDMKITAQERIVEEEDRKNENERILKAINKLKNE